MRLGLRLKETVAPFRMKHPLRDRNKNRNNPHYKQAIITEIVFEKLCSKFSRGIFQSSETNYTKNRW